MANKNGQVYGLTLFSPILESDGVNSEHASLVRRYLASLPRYHTSPFALVSSTHFARLVVIDDVVFIGAPTREEHLRSRYLLFEATFDGDLDTYLARMAREIPEHVDAIWTHCVGYPGAADVAAFTAYMKKCQIETTFFFADVNDRTVEQTLKAIQVQSALADFIERNQGKPPAAIQTALGELLEGLAHMPPPLAGGIESETAAAENSIDE